jgi:alpha-mannosidase
MSDNALMKVLSSRSTPIFLAKTALKLFALIHSIKSRKKPDKPGQDIHLKSPVYIMEGYHGGVLYWDWLILRKGGLWKTLIWPAVGESLLERAEKQGILLVLELDSVTFRYMAENQHSAFSRLKKLITEGVIEIVNGTFSQPLLQSLSGEAIIRQFEQGLTAIKETTGFKVSAYACQEPCFCSQLPQILNGFSIPYALIRTHWAPFGEETGINSPFISWVGPDGSSITAVPRYDWMDYSNRNDLYEGALRGNISGSHSSQWNKRWLESSICLASDMGTIPMLISAMEDLSPHESPIPASIGLADQGSIHFTTLTSFFKENAASHDHENITVKRFSSDDFIMSLPWGLEGDSLMSARDDAESALLAAERIDAIVHILGGMSREKELQHAWETLLTAQHHDFHICGPWLSLAHEKPLSAYAQDLCHDVWRSAENLALDSFKNLLPQIDTGEEENPCLVLFNPQAKKISDVFHIPGAWKVSDNVTGLQCQSDINKTSFYHEIPPLGLNVLKLEKTDMQISKHQIINDPSFANGYYKASIKRGLLGISAGDHTLLDNGSFFSVSINGHLIDSKGAGNMPVVTADGDILCRWELSGTIACIPYTQTYTFYKKLARIDVEAEFAFDENRTFGPEPSDGKGFYAMDGKKLCVCFPLCKGSVIRSAPFISEETRSETFIGNNWAGIEHDGSGLAVICPGARGFHYDKETGILRLVLAWLPSSWMYASDDSFTPNGSKYVRLKGIHRFRYSLLPYENRLDAARCAEEVRLPVSYIVGSHTPLSNPPDKPGFFSVSPDEVLLSALFVRHGRIFARLYNPTGIALEAELLSPFPLKISTCDMALDSSISVPDGKIRLRPYGVQTIGIYAGSYISGGEK